MLYDTSPEVPGDYWQRVKSVREARGLTQTQFAELVGVSFATVNRWENRQTRPSALAWSRIRALEQPPAAQMVRESGPQYKTTSAAGPDMDFAGDPEAVAAVVEAHRLTYGHLFNSAFAIETSLIDPLPHQRIAVYERMLGQSPLRFLLADDAGAGKTIMTGLYVREMLSRRLIGRVLIVPPAGLVGNWERELRTLFRLQFGIASGADARAGNPFVGADSDRLIVSLDTLAGERMFARLKDPETVPYDLVVFDEAHKLSANREPDLRVRKTERYRLAEAVAGAEADSGRWAMPWSAHHLLLLTATPHMGKPYPYFALWRLLLPDTLSTPEAFDAFAREPRRRHFIRRTKEEMVGVDGKPLYPKRNCDTLSYELTQGPGSEQELYDETTDYISNYYNRAKFLNRSAARLAMSVFQRRLASSTYALMRSFERRREKLELLIDGIRSGRLSEEALGLEQKRLDGLEDVFETQTSDEAAAGEDGEEEQEGFEEEALGATVAVSLAELEVERLKVEELLGKARSLYEAGEESKFEKLLSVLRSPKFVDEKLILFTEHRDTAEFLIRRLEGLGFTGRVAQIHGGMPYQERERQVEFFRRAAADSGGSYLVATDAAGEGINLQFCWLMVNYDIPWNPARLEQRMGRIHRYGQERDPVVIVNLVAGATREGRVMKTLLEKLETIRRQLGSDKVFDVIGRLFEGVSFGDYLAQAVAGDEGEVLRQIEGSLTSEQVTALEQRERSLYGEGGEVRRALPQLRQQAEQENYRRLIPGYVRRFVERAAPLLDLRIEGDPEEEFALAATRTRARDFLLTALEAYPEEARNRLTVHKPDFWGNAIWMHPGEPVFDRLAGTVIARHGEEALRGAVFIDPYADQPYLFHTALASVEQGALTEGSGPDAAGARLLDLRLAGLRQTGEGEIEAWPVERLLLLRGASGFAPGREPLAVLARRLVAQADEFAHDQVLEQHVQEQRRRILADLPARQAQISRGYEFLAAELATRRVRLAADVRAGVPDAGRELTRVKERQRSLNAARRRRLAELGAEADTVRAGEFEFLAHALVVPARDPETIGQFDVQVERVAMEVVTSYEESRGARVRDVSRPELARRAGLPDWPGFDMLSVDPGNGIRNIEVKGRARAGAVEISDNEWAAACNLRGDYWLYVVFACATDLPRLVRVRDPFGKLLASSRTSNSYTVDAEALYGAAEE
ncbi:MAG: helicase-related protein [Caldilineaceae bacterium]|nr:helicase-related protein [Caldilineaceae bacterium]